MKCKSKGGGGCHVDRTARDDRTARNVVLKGIFLKRLSSWYGSKGGPGIQTSFFGGIMEYWRRFETDSREKSIVDHRKYKEELEDTQCLGIRHSKLHGIFGVSSFDCLPAVMSEHLFVRFIHSRSGLESI